MAVVLERVTPTKPKNASTEYSSDELEFRRINLEEYQKLVKIGFFDEDERVELLEGMLVEMSPVNPRHADCIDQLNELLDCVTQYGGRRRIQSPITLAVSTSELLPDFTVVARSKKYGRQHPGAENVRLVVEVSDSSLAKDRGKKGELFARAGIAEYWIVNLNKDQLEIYRDPMIKSNGTGSYQSRTIFSPGQKVAPLAFPACEIEVAEIFPESGNEEL